MYFVYTKMLPPVQRDGQDFYNVGLATMYYINHAIAGGNKLVGCLRNGSIERFSGDSLPFLGYQNYVPSELDERLLTMAAEVVKKSGTFPTSQFFIEEKTGYLWIAAFNEKTAAADSFDNGYRVIASGNSTGCWEELAVLQKRHNIPIDVRNKMKRRLFT